MRSHSCGDLRSDAIDSTVLLSGWVDRCRDHGGVIFIDLRDRSGTVQITVDPDLGAEAFAVAEHLRNETVLQVEGRVRARPDESRNERLATGEVEVLAQRLKVLNAPSRNLPFAVSVHDDEQVREELRRGTATWICAASACAATSACGIKQCKPPAASSKTKASSKWKPRC